MSLQLKPGKLVVTTLLLLAAAVASLGAVLPRTAPLQKAKHVLAKNLGAVVGAPVTIERVEVTPAGNIRLRRVQLAKKTANASVSLWAGDVLVDLDLWRYLRSGNAMASIRKVSVHTVDIKAAGNLTDLRQLLPAPKAGTAGSMPFAVAFSDITAKWESYSWNERLLQVSPQSDQAYTARVYLSRTTLVGPKLPTSLSLSGSTLVAGTGLHDLRFRLATSAGSASATGHLQWGTAGKWDIHVDANRLQLKQWLAGQAPQPFDVSTQVGGVLAKPQVKFSTGTVVWQTWRADKVTGQVGLDKHSVTIHSLLATRKRATVSVKGSLPLAQPANAALTVKASGVTKAELAGLPNNWPLSGTASFAGTLQKTNENWQLNGQAGIQRGLLWQTAFSSMQAQVHIDTERLVLSNGKAILPGAQVAAYMFSGNYSFPEKLLSAEINSKGIPASDALAWPKLKWPVEGNVAGVVRIQGPLSHLTYSVAAAASSGSLWGQTFRNLNINLEYAAGTTTIQSARALVAGGQATVTGQVKRNIIDIAMRVEDALFDQLLQTATDQASKYAPNVVPTLTHIGKLAPAGLTTLSGSLKGELTQPTLAVSFAVAEAKIVGKSAGDWQGKLTGPIGRVQTKSDAWQISNGRINMGNGALTVDGTFAPYGSQQTPALLQLEGDINSLDIGPLTTLAQAIAQNTGSHLPTQMLKELASSEGSGHWSLLVPKNHRDTPELTANIGLSGKIAGYGYSASLAGRGWSNGVQLNQMRITAAGGTALLSGKLAMRDVHLSGKWSNLPAAVIGALAGIPQRLGGTLSGDINLASVADGLQGVLSWQAPLISVGDSQLSQVSGKIKAEGGRLALEQWRGTAAGRVVQVDGYVPLPSGLVGLIGGAGSNNYDLSVVVPRGPLAPLAGWLQLVPATRSSAAMFAQLQANGELRVHVGGSAKTPKFDGEASFDNGKVTLPAPWGNVEQAQGKVEFTGPTIRLVQTSAVALGGKVTAQADITLRPGASPTVHGRADGSLKPKVTGISGEGSLRLLLDGTLAEPHISGDVDIRKVEINVTDLPQMGGGKGGKVPALRFDVNIKLRQLWVKAASLLDVPASGTLKLNGTLADLGLAGQVQSDRGRVNYLGTNFTIEEATADFSPYRGLVPSLNLWGTTWVGRNTIALQISGVPTALRVRLSSDPPLSQQEILALLEWPGQLDKLGSGNTGEMARGIVEVLQGGIELGLMNGLEDAVRDTLGLDEFRLEPDLSERSIRLSAGKYLMPRIYMTYDRSLFATPEQDIRLEYRLDNGWKVSAGLLDGGEVRLGVEAKVRF